MNKKIDPKEKNSSLEQRFNEWQQSKIASRFRITLRSLSSIFFILLTLGIGAVIFFVSIGIGYFASLVAEEPLRTKEEMRSEVFDYEESTELYFADNIYLGKVNTDLERKETTLDLISPYVIQAVLATEDEYFYEHDGIVPKAIFRGVLQDLTNATSQTGGSTLTQQLIKNQILTNEVSYERKAKEILLALRLEHFMEKEEILEAYLNIIPYGRDAMGQNIAGIETAAQGVFNRSAKDLTLPQAAFLAGIPQAPYAYTPFRSTVSGGGLKEDEYLQAGIQRMKTVLFRMHQTGRITDKEYEEAVQYDITQDFREPDERVEDQYPYLTQEIQNRTIKILSEIIAKEEGIDPKRFEQESHLRKEYEQIASKHMRTKGYKIHSTIDKNMYDEMNRVAREFPNYGFTYTRQRTNPETGEITETLDPVQVGSIMIENKTGRILSFVGGRDYDLENLNHATQAYRQNGSSMKPLLVYGPAIEYGVIGAGSPVVDVKFDKNGWSPSNYVSEYEAGLVPAREALAKSLNIATARLYNDILPNQPAQFLEKMGFSRLSPDDYQNLSASFGGLTHGVSVEENTNAFGTFANGGKYVPSYLIEKIETLDGTVIYEHETESVDVFSEDTSYIVTDMLRDVLKPNGTAPEVYNYMTFRPDLAVKTGTTDFHGDSWLVGYTPEVSLGVWIGYKDKVVNGIPRDLSKRSVYHPTQRTSMLFGQLMSVANQTNPNLVHANSQFERPETVVSETFCGVSGKRLSNACSAAGFARTDLFSKKHVPKEMDESFLMNGGTPVLSEAFKRRLLFPLGGDPEKLYGGSSILGAFPVTPLSMNVMKNEVEPPVQTSSFSTEEDENDGELQEIVTEDEGAIEEPVELPEEQDDGEQREENVPSVEDDFINDELE